MYGRVAVCLYSKGLGDECQGYEVELTYGERPGMFDSALHVLIRVDMFLSKSV